MKHEQWIKLNPEEQQIKVAELCGWTEITYHDDLSPLLLRNNHFEEGYYGRHPSHHYLGLNPIPDYLNDLNAMHEAELSHIYCSGGDREERIIDYSSLLDVLTLDACVMASCATAAQRAEAFVLTMDKGE